MIAFVLRETGRDPAWLIGAPVPQLGVERGRGGGLARRRGRRVRPHRRSRCRPEIAVVTNVELDHHTEFASLAELEAEFDAWLARRAARRARRAAVRRRARVAGRAQPPERRRGAGGARARRASPRDEAAPALARFTGHRPPLRGARAGGVTVVDDYGHHPTEIAATIAAARERFPGAALRVLFQPHLYSRTRHLAGELAAALAAADDVAVTDVYPAREAAGRRA